MLNNPITEETARKTRTTKLPNKGNNRKKRRNNNGIRKNKENKV